MSLPLLRIAELQRLAERDAKDFLQRVVALRKENALTEDSFNSARRAVQMRSLMTATAGLTKPGDINEACDFYVAEFSREIESLWGRAHGRERDGGRARRRRMPKNWWKLPAGHPVRVWHEMDQARRQLRLAKSRAADDGMFPMRETALRLAQSELKKCQERYDRKRAAWEAAGQPDQHGTRHAPRRQAEGATNA